MWQSLKNFFGFSDPQPATDAANAALADAQAAAMAQLQAQQPAANDESYSLTGDVNTVLAKMLRMQTVQKHGPHGTILQAAFPVSKVSLTPTDGYNNLGHVHAIRIGDDEVDSSVPQGKGVNLDIELSGAVEDFDPKSLKEAAVRLVGAIPAFKGKVVVKPIKDEPKTYKDVEAELLAVLAKHPQSFKAEEIAVLKQFFEAQLNAKDEAPFSRWDNVLRATHSEGKVKLQVYGRELPSDKTASVSSDSLIVDHFKANRKQWLEKAKQKVLALRKPDGSPVVTEADLANLDLHATTSEWNIELLLGTKSASNIDPATNKKWTGEQRAKQFTETALANVDTNQLSKIFTEALVEVSQPIPPIMARIMDGHMLASILRQRLPNNPDLEAFLGKHDMFMSVEEKRAKAPKVHNSDEIALAEPMIFDRNDMGRKDGARVSVTFNLPQGMELHDLYRHIAASKSQLGFNVQAANETQLGGR